MWQTNPGLLAWSSGEGDGSDSAGKNNATVPSGEAYDFLDLCFICEYLWLKIILP
jgi:hypothetical protein